MVTEVGISSIEGPHRLTEPLEVGSWVALVFPCDVCWVDRVGFEPQNHSPEVPRSVVVARAQVASIRSTRSRWVTAFRDVTVVEPEACVPLPAGEVRACR